MRLQIRWQQHLADHLQEARDVQCEVAAFDPLTLRGKALCTFASPDAVPSEWLRDGELVELVNGCRVLAVGKIAGP